ncbi:MAG: ISNCY family transposase [Deltaproteobacteria bacterium]|jgi:transposase, IS5 family|nr:ISNCY family transposase [Deltaproteobacteria bacterium]MBT4269626.1 ISNCY family transposase [Deltaproteobacteria bacterium]MBT4640746.1 ISNCY family transposase [Deltaproteobacteria bacterium]MBT6500044.1 ISNCY family transposase [Deltaproteobacteria bacterium]MBT6610613.1 ISNCY family transposase [Deltaproteobacteria bacterium]
MRKVIEEQMKLGEIDISQIKFDLQSRDEIPKLLMGLQYIYTNPDLRAMVFDMLTGLTPPHIDPETGRCGMDYWKILVLGTLRLACNFDFDKLKEIADNHATVRQMLCHSAFDIDLQYPLQTVRDNVSLLTPEVLDRINRCVVGYGHNLLGKNQIDCFHARCDSFVVETNVHYPTDINLLLDAMRKVITLISYSCAEAGISDWRQSPHNLRKLKKLYRRAQNLKRSTSKDPKKKAQKVLAIQQAHLGYLDLAVSFLKKTDETIEKLRRSPLVNIDRVFAIERYVSHANRQIEQIYRRVILNEKIAHDEKVFSIFEEHTEWISKGKAGVSQELGLKVCIVEDQYGFIVHHRIMQKQDDKDVAVSIIKEAKVLFPNLTGCSFDKGFYSPDNVKKLTTILDRLTLPKKGKLSQKQKEHELTEEFVQSRRHHSSVESAINALENHGLDRCPDKGIDAFKRYISLAVLSRNIQITGNIFQQKKRAEEERKKKYRQTWENNRADAGQSIKAA